jgi:hypothetical protein
VQVKRTIEAAEKAAKELRVAAKRAAMFQD